MNEHPIILLTLESAYPITPGSSCMIVMRPQIGPLRPVRCQIPLPIARCFSIEDIRVGNRSQFPQAQSVPAERFAMPDPGGMTGDERALVHDLIKRGLVVSGAFMSCETIQTAMDFLMVVTNRSELPMAFVATWDCLTIDDQARPPRFPAPERSRHVSDDAIIAPRRAEPTKPRPANAPRKDPPGFGWDPDWID